MPGLLVFSHDFTEKYVMSSFWKIASLAVCVATLCGCSTMRDSTRFDELPTHYWNSLATDSQGDSPANESW